MNDNERRSGDVSGNVTSATPAQGATEESSSEDDRDDEEDDETDDVERVAIQESPATETETTPVAVEAKSKITDIRQIPIPLLDYIVNVVRAWLKNFYR